MASRPSQARHGGPLVWLGSFAAVGSVIVAIVAATLYAFGSKTPTLDDLIRQMRSELLEPTQLRVGIIPDQPGLSFRSDGKISGFDVDLARKFGEFAGFREPDIVFHDVRVDNRQRALDPDSGHTDNLVDVVWSSYSITESRKREVDFSSTYFVTNQDALVLSDRKDLTNGDVQLKTRRVCTTGGSTAEDSLRSQGYLNVKTSSTNTACLEGLRENTYDGFIKDHAVLAGIKLEYAPEFEVANIAYSGDERWGVGVPKGHSALLMLVNCFITDSYLREHSGRNSAWQDAFDANLAHLGGISPGTKQPKPDQQQTCRSSEDLNNAPGAARPPAGGARPVHARRRLARA